MSVFSSIKLDVSAPAADLYTFRGSLTCPELDNFKMDLDIKQFLHRGAILKNSEYIDAVVIYTGVQTKLVLNQGKYKFKISQLDRAINMTTLFNLVLMLLMAGFVTLMAYSFESKYDVKPGE